MVVIIISKDVDCFKVGLVLRQNRNQTVYGGGGGSTTLHHRGFKKEKEKRKKYAYPNCCLYAIIDVLRVTP